MLRVRCISGCVTGRPLFGARFPTLFWRKLGSIFPSVAGSSEGNSTTRNFVPLSGGDIPIGLVAGSSLNENPGGYESVIHRLSDVIPYGPGPSVRRLSNSTIALLLASSPVTTRRISDAAPVEEDSKMITIAQNILRMIGTPLSSSVVCATPKHP